MRDFEDIRYEKDDGVAIVTIDRPDKMNAFRAQTCRELIEAFEDAWADGTIGVVVLTGAGDRAFCTGGDVSVRGESGYAGEGSRHAIGLDIEEVHSIIRDIPKPVIAAVNGYAIGGGHVLHVICDLTIAADTARFGQVGPKVGSVDPGFGTAYLARVVGEKKAREFWYLCEQYTAEECRQLGLVNKVVPAAELMDATMAWARRIVDMSPTAITIAKQSFNTDSESIRAVGALGISALALYYGTDEAMEGQRAFTERRPPNFRQYQEMKDPHADLRDAVRQICTKFPDEYWRQREAAHEFPWDFYRAFADAGYVGIAIPEEYGGGGAGITEASILLEEIAASGACLNGCSAIHLSVFGMNPVVHHGSDEMKATYLPQVASGELHVSFGVTEPDAGTDTTNISTRATAVESGWRIRGRKIWNTKAHIAGKCLLLARTTPLTEVRKRTDGMTLFLADLQVPEVAIVPIPKLGRNAVASCEVSFDDLFVAETDVVGEVGRGFHHLLDGLNPERILLAAEALGIGRAAIRRAVAYANERIVFGRPIGQNQGLAFPLADAHMRLGAAELVIRDASARYDAGLPCGEQANSAKYLAAEAAWDAADRAVQTHGGMGYATEYDVERYWREARLIRIAPISQEMILNYVAEHVLGLPRSY